MPDLDYRRRRIATRLAAAQTPFQFIDGVRADRLGMGELRALCPDFYMPGFWRNITLPEIGCSLAHRDALAAFLGTDAASCLILEDDAAIAPNSLADLPRWLAMLPAGWGVLKLGGPSGRTRGWRMGGVGRFTLVRTPLPSLNAQAYLVSRGGAELLLKHFLPILYPFDVYLREACLHQATMFEAVPELIGTAPDDFSQIETARLQGDRSRTRTLAQWLRNRAWRARRKWAQRRYLLRHFGWPIALAPWLLPTHGQRRGGA